MYFKTRILFIPTDKIIIKPKMVSDDVIVIRYNFETDNYSTLKSKFSHVINKHKNKILNIKSVGILTASSNAGISVTKAELLDVNAKYDANDISVVKFESLVHFMYNALLLVGDKKQLIQLDLIASNVISDKATDMLPTISSNTSMIINTSRSDIYNYNCVMDYSTRYADAHCNRSLIGRYFTCKIKMLHDSLSIKNSVTDVVSTPSSGGLLSQFTQLIESTLANMGNFTTMASKLREVVAVLSIILSIAKASGNIPYGTITDFVMSIISPALNESSMGYILINLFQGLFGIIESANTVEIVVNGIITATKLFRDMPSSSREMYSAEISFKNIRATEQLTLLEKISKFVLAVLSTPIIAGGNAFSMLAILIYNIISSKPVTIPPPTTLSDTDKVIFNAIQLYYMEMDTLPSSITPTANDIYDKLTDKTLFATVADLEKYLPLINFPALPYILISDTSEPDIKKYNQALYTFAQTWRYNKPTDLTQDQAEYYNNIQSAYTRAILGSTATSWSYLGLSNILDSIEKPTTLPLNGNYIALETELAGIPDKNQAISKAALIKLLDTELLVTANAWNITTAV